MNTGAHGVLGVVVRKWFGADSGHYVIRGAEGESEAHYSDIFTEAFRHLEVGDRVRYRIKLGDSGPRAVYVVRLPDDDEDWLYDY